jgi:hypothetical protein
MDVESTKGMEFRRESPVPGRNLPKEWNSSRNYRLLDEESTGRMEFRRELLAHGHGFRPARSKVFRLVLIPGKLTVKDRYPNLKNFKYENFIKMKIILIRPYYELNICLLKL